MSKYTKTLIATILSTLIICFAPSAYAKSVYVITGHWGSTITAYKVQGEQITPQTNVSDTTGGRGFGSMSRRRRLS